MLIKMKMGKKKKNKKLERKEYLTLRRSTDLVQSLKALTGGSRAHEELKVLIKNMREKIRLSDEQTPVTFSRDVKGLGTFEFKGEKTPGIPLSNLYKQASLEIKKQISEKRKARALIVPSPASFNTSDGENHQMFKLGPNGIRNVIDIGWEKEVVDGKVKFIPGGKLVGTGKRLEEIPINTGVFSEPGTILKIMNWKHCKSIFDAKAPTDTNKYVGIELEFYCEAINKTLAYAFHEKKLIKYLSLVTDGSIRPEAGKIGHELRILCREDEVEMVVTGVCEVLSKYNAKVNKSCGTHVHLDMRHRDRKTVFYNLVKAQNILYKMNPKSRKDGEFCKPTPETNLDDALASGASGRAVRYQGVNAQALSRHQTLEVRIHAGMVNASKIINWVKLLTHVANLTEATVDYKTTLGFFKKYSIPADLKEYILKRIEFTKSGELDIEEAA